MLFILFLFLHLFISTINAIQTTQQAVSVTPQTPHKVKQTPAKTPATINPLMQKLKTAVVSGKTEIPVCSSLPLKGETALVGNEIFDGLTLFFNQFKKDKANTKLSFNLATLDDEAEVTKTKANISKLQKKSPLFVGFFGPEIIAAIKPFISTQKIAVFCPIDGVESFRTFNYPNMIFYRPPCSYELAALAHYAINTLNKKKIAIFYEASEWGEESLNAIKHVLKTRYNLTPLAIASYPQKTVNISQAVNTIANAAPNAIICIAQSRPAYNFICQIINKGLHQTTFLGTSSLFSIQETLNKSRGISIILSSVVPDPFKSKLQIAQEYRNAMKKFFPNKALSPFSFEGYINGALFAQSVQQTPIPYSALNIILTAKNMRNISYKGLPLTFNPTTQSLSTNIWINCDSKNEWFLSQTQ